MRRWTISQGTGLWSCRGPRAKEPVDVVALEDVEPLIEAARVMLNVILEAAYDESPHSHRLEEASQGGEEEG